ncbi:hypothetical protein CHARACLAT_012110 [Characodon lateralis]|uniref:Uncharacterized protein n=1 Tax=Characodon lateralis TaxID=208331 RepID=A0ABU7E211_9TELE|nr:hypothetical protein [Characodon lateralis]
MECGCGSLSNCSGTCCTDRRQPSVSCCYKKLPLACELVTFCCSAAVSEGGMGYDPHEGPNSLWESVYVFSTGGCGTQTAVLTPDADLLIPLQEILTWIFNPLHSHLLQLLLPH